MWEKILRPDPLIRLREALGEVPEGSTAKQIKAGMQQIEDAMVHDEVDPELTARANEMLRSQEARIDNMSVKQLLTLAAEKAYELNEEAAVDLRFSYVNTSAGMVDITFMVGRS